MTTELRKYIVFRALAGVFGVLPEFAVRRLGMLLGRLAARLAPERVAMAERHMRRAMGPGGDAAAAARQMLASYGRYWAEVFWMRPRKQRTVAHHTDVVGKWRVDEVVGAGNGIILALPHMGNWEAAGTTAAAVGYPVLAVAEALENRRIADWFVRVRGMYGIDVVLAERGSNVFRTLIARLRQGGTVALPCDRDVTGDGVTVTFFGEQTTLPAGPVALADRTGAALFPVGTYFKEGRGHRLVVHPRLEIPDAPTREERIAKGTQELAYRLEDIIGAAPTQWHIISPNWPSDRRT